MSKLKTAEIFSYANMPWPGVGDSDIIDSINNGAKLERPAGVPLSCYDVMLSCWHLDPNDRPSAPGLLKMIDQLDDKDLEMPAMDAGIVRHSTASSTGSKSSSISRLISPSLILLLLNPLKE